MNHHGNAQKRRWVLAVAVGLSGLILLSCERSSAIAQSGGDPTPAPLLTRQAELEVTLSAIGGQRDEVAQLRQKASEIERNVDTQAQQAASAYADVKAAISAQNYAAAGEALGRGEATLKQLTDSVKGLQDVNNQLSSDNGQLRDQLSEALKAQGQLSQQLQEAQSGYRTLFSNYQALQTANEQSGKTDFSTTVAWLFVALVVAVILGNLLWRVFTGRYHEPPPEREAEEPPIESEATWSPMEESHE